MAADVGSASRTVAQTLAERTSDFSFLKAMWLLQQSHPGSVPVGYQGPPDEEAVRLRPSSSLGFPPCDLESVEAFPEGRPPFRLTTTFLGLYGAHSPLPSYYAEEILHADEEDNPVRAFVDIFNHRLLSLFYRGLLRYRGHLLFRPTGEDEYSWRIFALAGLGTDGLADATGLPRARLLRFAGHFCHKPQSAASIAAVLSTFLKIPVRVQQCVQRWVYFNRKDRTRLGEHACQLGENATIGDRVADRIGKFRLSIGPVDYGTYKSLLPKGERLTALSRLAKLASGGWLDFDFEIILKGDDTPKLGVTLASHGELGRTTGLFTRAADDVPVVFAGCTSPS